MVSVAVTSESALSFLFQRLKWPVPMSRWRTAKEIRNLLENPRTRLSATDALLDYIDQCRTESEVCEILTIVFLTSPAERPARTALVSRVHRPSILADMILERTCGPGRGVGGWSRTHSGRAPADFRGGSYFEKHKTAHVPPIFESNLAMLESASGHPFQRQWAYEWRHIREELGTALTGNPYYFDDVLDVRAGIVGQYWQRMRDVYLSAYLRTLAYGVSEWGMPRKIAEDCCIDIVHGVSGLFDLEPSNRPAWLAEFPERLCARDADFASIVRELVQAARADGMRLVSLSTPVAASVQKYADLMVSAHLVTRDYEMLDAAFPHESVLVLPVEETFQLKGRPVAITIQEASVRGRKGDQVAVCSQLLPMPFDTWQGDYFSIGLRVPAPYVLRNSEIRCSGDSIDCVASDGNVASRTKIWNDNWRPQHPDGGSTRCGTATMIKHEVLAEAMARTGRRLAYFTLLRIWGREKEYGEYSEWERTFFSLAEG
jgi:hypothetical protein